MIPYSRESKYHKKSAIIVNRKTDVEIDGMSFLKIERINVKLPNGNKMELVRDTRKKEPVNLLPVVPSRAGPIYLNVRILIFCRNSKVLSKKQHMTTTGPRLSRRKSK
jgi:hypothetical protein